MGTTTADAKKRVVIPAAKPGDVFDVQTQGEGRYLLVRLQAPKAPPRKTKKQCLAALSASPLRLELSWDELKRITREP